MRSRRYVAAASAAVVALWAALRARGGMLAVALYFLSTILFLHILAAHDAFQALTLCSPTLRISSL